MKVPHRLILMGTAVGCLFGCRNTFSEAPMHLEVARTVDATRLTLVTSPGLRLSARLKPALELADGSVLRFDSPSLSPDSAYFADPPSVLRPGHLTSIHGTLRASVCDTGAAVCRSVVVRM